MNDSNPLRCSAALILMLLAAAPAALGEGDLGIIDPGLGGVSLGSIGAEALAPDAADESGQPPAGETPPSLAPSGQRLRTYELPAITVQGQPGSSLREEELIGSYGQPRWTASRRFPSTRVYVIPEGKVEMELWCRPTFNRDGSVETRSLAEVEFGLPGRFQIDLYLRADKDGGDRFEWGGQFEVRWALADWGKLWGNPTLYFEYLSLADRPDKIEPKLLLGGEVPQWGEGWHWGVNFVAELEINGPELEHEYEFTSGLSKSIVDSVFSAGAEFKPWPPA